MEQLFPYTNRDLSWLTFNYRVLQEAKDPSVPLFERIKFMAIFSSNLDEFFRVRVAHHRNLVRVGKKTRKELGYDPSEILKKLHNTVNEHQEEYSNILLNQIIPELKKHQIFIRGAEDLNPEQKAYVESFFQENMLPYVQPVLLSKHKIRIFLNNAALYLACHLRLKNENKRKMSRYAILQVPSNHLPRFIILPGASPQKHELILLDDVVRFCMPELFPGFEIENTYSIKLTRDAELYIDDEFSGDLISKIKSSLKKRNVGPATRFVYDRTIPRKFLKFLMEDFSLGKFDILPEGRYHNNFDFFHFPHFGMHHLRNTPLPPLKKKAFETGESIFDVIKKKDYLIHVPFQTYEYTIRLFEEAAKDPDVTHIKIVQYRVANKSRIMRALMDAVKVGKQVTAFVEVKARFDEEANLKWAERLEKAGVRVLYSFPGLKVHSKVALITREENGSMKNYCYLSTGNFHEGTARVYSDFGLFTADRRLTDESARLFNYLETQKRPHNKFKHFLVGQFNLRPSLNKFIDDEIERARAGQEAKIILKLNSLEDSKMIARLYEASQAGVKIKLIVRGICCLVPGVPGISDNIEAFSIVDRFLEHSRIYYFYGGGEEKIYLSSADWMKRNLSYRIETAFPIYDNEIRKEIKDFLRIQFHDNVKARIVDGNQNDNYRKDDSDLPVRAQLETYYYLKRKEEMQENLKVSEKL
ncbi:MAG: polyphosphate kinase 1 [Bacteroidota bacterium]